MEWVREYTWELCWLLLVVALFVCAPSPSHAGAFNWDDGESDCSSADGWCVPPI